MGHLAEIDELAEVLAGVLRAIIADDSRLLIRIRFAGFLDGDLCVRLRHTRLEVPAKDCSTCPVEDAGEVVEDASYFEISEVCMPVLMGLERLLKARSFLGLFTPRFNEPFLLENTVNARRTNGHDVAI